MKPIDVLEPLLLPIKALQSLIEQFEDQGTIIGGVAVSILGKPRLTGDADAVILLSIEEIPQLLEYAKTIGLIPRLPDVEAFARRSRVILLKHEETGINVDISLGIMPFEVEMVERSQEYIDGSFRARLPTAEDLIILKAVAHRPKDMLDIETIVAVQTSLDLDRIRSWVQQFADVLEAPEIMTDLEEIIKKGVGH